MFIKGGLGNVNIYQILPVRFWIVFQHFLQKALWFQRERLQQIVDLFQSELKSKPEILKEKRRAFVRARDIV